MSNVFDRVTNFFTGGEQPKMAKMSNNHMMQP